MPLYSIKATEALKNRKKNPFSFYPGTHNDDYRISPYALPNFEPSFSIEPGESIFTVGSCFARNIEQKFENMGFDIPATRWLNYREKTIEHDITHNPEKKTIVSSEYLNKYDPFAILNEVRWALSDDYDFPDNGLLDLGNGTWYDPYCTPTPFGEHYDRIKSHREEVSNIFSQAKKCRIIVITLGMVEAWLDKKTNLFMNFHPHVRAISNNPERFDLVIHSYSDILNALNEIHGLFTLYGHPDFKILLTVSPVPLNFSFRGKDILTANCYSKSVLRAASEEFVLEHDNVDYFPSYESVSLTEHSLAYEKDHRHVTQQAVAINIARMIKMYVNKPVDIEHILAQYNISKEHLEQICKATHKEPST